MNNPAELRLNQKLQGIIITITDGAVWFHLFWYYISKTVCWKKWHDGDRSDECTEK